MTAADRPTIRRIGVVGAGAWGTALAIVARRAGAEVVLWARRPELAEEISASRENSPYMPGVALDPAIWVTADMARLAKTDALLLVVPAQQLRAICGKLEPFVPSDRPLIVCAKGIEQGSHALMTEVLDQVLPDRPQAVLSGPSFAAESARDLPTAVTLAVANRALGEALITALGNPRFRIYLSPDPIGAQIGGATKNVVAIACGIVSGRRMGDNARAALITRALAEIIRLGVARGARAETFMGLSGLGDLTLTCSATQSRNYSLGQALGEGESLKAILGARHSVAEGVFTAQAVTDLAGRLSVETPIASAVDQVLNHGADIDETINALLARPLRVESA